MSYKEDNCLDCLPFLFTLLERKAKVVDSSIFVGFSRQEFVCLDRSVILIKDTIADRKFILSRLKMHSWPDSQRFPFQIGNFVRRATYSTDYFRR